MRGSILVLTIAVALTACKQQDASQPASAAAGANNNVTATENPPAPAPEKYATAKSWDGPLGLKKGLSRAELEKVIPLEPGKSMSYISKTAPMPYEKFILYRYLISDTHGLCSVRALTSDIETNVFGTGLKDAFNQISEPLSEKYGKATFSTDYVRKGSLWTSGEDWMIGLMKGDRELSQTWFAKTGSDRNAPVPANLPPGLENISLEAQANSMDKGFVMIEYAFDNNDQCIDEVRKLQNRPL